MTTVSVIVPVYNEAGTIRQVLDLLTSKVMPGVVLQIIVVDSGSTDGTQDIIKYHPMRSIITLAKELHPMGKGHAVRCGLAFATGDVVMIQDADLEYRIDDYEKLLRPIIDGETDFVLGSRHSKGVMSIRQFSEQPLLSLLMNLGHWFFVGCIGILFGAFLVDPFTMYKVFRRKCIKDMTFCCNRFDFDFELLIKLLKRGYRPLEIPVTYVSRSFKEGKKVRLFRDPPTWCWTMLRLWMT